MKGIKKEIFDACYNAIDDKLSHYSRGDNSEDVVDVWVDDRYYICIYYYYERFYDDYFDHNSGYFSDPDGADFYISKIEVFDDEDRKDHPEMVNINELAQKVEDNWL